MRHRLLLVPLLVSVPYSHAYAQDAGALLRDKERAREAELPEQERTEGDPLLPLDAETAADEQTVLIRTVEFSGRAELLDEAERARLAALLTGQTVGFAGLRSFVDQVNASLRRDGHLLAQAIIPPQDVTGGTLVIDIQVGTLEGISIEREPKVRVREQSLASIFDHFVDRERVTGDALETALLRMNDLPGVSARARLAPGDAPASSRVIIDVSQEPILSGGLAGDNFGSPSTGEVQGHAQAALSDLTGYGDQARLGFSYSKGQRYGSLGFSMPLSANGLRVGFDFAYLSYQNVDPIGEAAGLEGEAYFGTARLDWQLIRSRAANLALNVSFGGKRLIDEASAGRLSDKELLSGSIGFSGDVTDEFLGGGVTRLAVTWTLGELDLSALPVNELLDSIGLQTQGTFHRLNADALRLQRLGGGFSLLARASGQWASKNLDSSESFSLGGPYGVRGWPIGEGRGDMGVVGTMELRYQLPLPQEHGDVQLSAYVDAGHTWLNENSFGFPQINACGCNDYSLASAGVGITWQQESFSLSAGWAHGLGDNPGRNIFDNSNADGGASRQRFWLNAAVQF